MFISARHSLMSFLLVSPLVMTSAMVCAQSQPPSQTAKPVKANETSNGSLSAFFSEFRKKRATVGGTVLRGDSGVTTPNDTLNRPVMLTDLAVFKVLPGGDKLTLRWDSTPEQQWLLKIAQHEVVVRGGSADLPMPQVSQDVLHVWELTEVDVPTKHLVGHWFILSGVEATDVHKLSNLLADYRSRGQFQAGDYREVCQWLYEEQLVYFNQWCLNP